MEGVTPASATDAGKIDAVTDKPAPTDVPEEPEGRGRTEIPGKLPSLRLSSF